MNSSGVCGDDLLPWEHCAHRSFVVPFLCLVGLAHTSAWTSPSLLSSLRCFASAHLRRECASALHLIMKLRPRQPLLLLTAAALPGVSSGARGAQGRARRTPVPLPPLRRQANGGGTGLLELPLRPHAREEGPFSTLPYPVPASPFMAISFNDVPSRAPQPP